MPGSDAKELLALIDRLAGPLVGNRAVDVDGTEKRLGHPLPPDLREIYLGAGCMARLWDARARGGWAFRGLGGLHMEGDLLVFASEQQACFEWATDLASGANVVFEGTDGDWTATNETLITFIRGLVLFHCSSCTRDWEGGVSVPRDCIERIVESWTHVAFRPLCTQLDFFVQGGVVLRCDWSDKTATVFAGGADTKELKKCVKALGFDVPPLWPKGAL